MKIESKLIWSDPAWSRYTIGIPWEHVESRNNSKNHDKKKAVRELHVKEIRINLLDYKKSSHFCKKKKKVLQ